MEGVAGGAWGFRGFHGLRGLKILGGPESNPES